jgi:hypothetical protein
MFDLPHPLGPTTPANWLGKSTIVGSTNDLKPAIFSLIKRTELRGQKLKEGKARKGLKITEKAK